MKRLVFHFGSHIGLIALGCTLVFGLLVGCTSRVLYPDVGPDPDILIRKWTRQTRSIWEAGDRGTDRGSAALFENTLVFASEGGGLISTYPGSDQVRWRVPIPKGITSAIEVAGQFGFFGSGDGNLYCIQLQTGALSWKYEIRSSWLSKPLVHEGRLFVTTSDDAVYALDAGSGQWLWNYRRRSTPPASVQGAATPTLVQDQANGTLIVGLSDGYLVGINPQDGNLKWEKKLQQGGRFTDVNATAVVDQGQIYVPTYDGALYALRLSDREVIWKYDAGGSRQVLVESGRILMPSSDGAVVALDRSTGRELWRFSLEGGVPTELTTVESWIIFGSSDRFLYALDQHSGVLKYRWNVGEGSGFSGRPLYDGKEGRLYVASRAGNLYAFATRFLGRKGQKNPYRNGFNF